MSKYTVEKRTSWTVPKETDARILGGPNLPLPLHGQGHNPRTIMGTTAWDRMRKRGYYLSGYKCEICGADCSTPGTQDFHELYTINYTAGTSTFVRAVAICKKCHQAYHSGRLLTLYKQGAKFYSQATFLNTAEHCFKLINEWNKKHPGEKKLKAYETWLEALKREELSEKLEKLIDEYEIEFWEEDKKKLAKWSDWKLIFGNREYPTRYKTRTDWEKAMEEASKKDTARMSTPFSGGVFDEISSLIKEE